MTLIEIVVGIEIEIYEVIVTEIVEEFLNVILISEVRLNGNCGMIEILIMILKLKKSTIVSAETESTLTGKNEIWIVRMVILIEKTMTSIVKEVIVILTDLERVKVKVIYMEREMV